MLPAYLAITTLIAGTFWIARGETKRRERDAATFGDMPLVPRMLSDNHGQGFYTDEAA